MTKLPKAKKTRGAAPLHFFLWTRCEKEWSKKIFKLLADYHHFPYIRFSKQQRLLDSTVYRCFLVGTYQFWTEEWEVYIVGIKWYKVWLFPSVRVQENWKKVYFQAEPAGEHLNEGNLRVVLEEIGFEDAKKVIKWRVSSGISPQLRFRCIFKN